MEERKISERNKKYNDEHSSSMTHNKILNAREANLLKLRRNKIEEQIMSKRMKNFTGVFEPSKYSHLELSEEDFSFVITEQYEQEFNNYDQKLEIIKQLLNEDYSSLQYFNINCANHDIITKYAVYKLRVMSFEWKSVNDEGVEFDTELFDQLLVILFNTRDLKLQVRLILTFRQKSLGSSLT